MPLPVIFKAAIQERTAESENRVSSVDGPEHARSFETGSNHRLAASFDDARTHEKVQATKLGIPHTFRIALKVVRLRADLLGYVGMIERKATECAHQFFDFPFIQQAFLVDLHPGFLLLFLVRIELANHLPQMLARVVEINNLNGARKVQGDQSPDPFRSVAYNSGFR